MALICKVFYSFILQQTLYKAEEYIWQKYASKLFIMAMYIGIHPDILLPVRNGEYLVAGIAMGTAAVVKRIID